MSFIPDAIKKIVDDIVFPVALIGCRTSELSFDCCEYDLAVFAPERNNKNKVLQIDEGKVIEIIYFTRPIQYYMVDLGTMAILGDSDKFAPSSAARDIRPEKYCKALAVTGKKSLISSLFFQQRMINEIKNQTVAAMWLKIAAYEFISGSLAMLGIRPMPLHELEQVRKAEADSRMADGIRVALECIGTERATRPAISRSLEAVQELKSKDYDRELVMSKIRHLLDKHMLANCYYYAGRVAAKSLADKNIFFHNKYSKLIQLALDLTSDTQHLQKLQKELFRAADSSLKD
jgi:hypothetical protein